MYNGITWANVAYNLMLVTAGNISGGAVFLAPGYYYISGPFTTK
jgi:formate/nitrite transporter FocA (FNT family)